MSRPSCFVPLTDCLLEIEEEVQMDLKPYFSGGGLAQYGSGGTTTW